MDLNNCEETRPNRESLSTTIADISSINMFDFWRDLQLFSMSCLSVIQHGDTEPPEQLVDTRYLKQNDSPELYSLLSTDHAFDGDWYVYHYVNSDVFGKPADDGEIFYNTLDNETVDKFEIFYVWDGSTFERDSLFIGNISEPTNAGLITYIHNKNKTVTKAELDYVFLIDRYEPFYKTLETFVPPADNGTESCLDKRTVVKKYVFDEDTETWVSNDYVLGYIVGKCGYTGYTVTGTATSHAWSITSLDNTFTISNDTMTQALLDDGLIPATSVGQKIVVTVTELGTFTVSGSFNLGFGSSFSLTSLRNVLSFSIVENVSGAISMDRNGSTKESMVAYFTYDHVIGGVQYKIDSITLDGTAGNIKLDVDTQDPADIVGSIIITI